MPDPVATTPELTIEQARTLLEQIKAAETAKTKADEILAQTAVAQQQVIEKYFTERQEVLKSLMAQDAALQARQAVIQAEFEKRKAAALAAVAALTPATPLKPDQLTAARTAAAEALKQTDLTNPDVLKGLTTPSTSSVTFAPGTAADGSRKVPVAPGAKSLPRTLPDGTIDNDPDDPISANSDYVANDPTRSPFYINLEASVSMPQADKIVAADSQIALVLSQRGVEFPVADKITASGRALIKYFIGDGGGERWVGEGSGRLGGSIATALPIIRAEAEKAIGTEHFSTIHIDNIPSWANAQNVADMLKEIMAVQKAHGKPIQFFAANNAAYVEIARDPAKYGLPAEAASYFVGGTWEPSGNGDGVQAAREFSEIMRAQTAKDGRPRPTTLLAFGDTSFNEAALRKVLGDPANKYLSGSVQVSESRNDSTETGTVSIAAANPDPKFPSILPTAASAAGQPGIRLMTGPEPQSGGPDAAAREEARRRSMPSAPVAAGGG